MGRHAYLIITHNEFSILEKLIKLIDDERNDIYIHLDKKVKSFDFNYYSSISKKSKVYFVKRYDVRWGMYNMINAEYALLKKATSVYSYDYYHLISGVDMIVKTQDEIHAFFDNQKGKEFVHFVSFKPVEGKIQERMKYYHLFLKNYKRGTEKERKVAKIRHDKILDFQKKHGISRIKGIEDKFMYGSQWFSITDEFARYLISIEKDIKKKFKYSSCPDEHVVQYALYNSKFYSNLYNDEDDYSNVKRLIDWNRGGPYTFKVTDYDEIIGSGAFFVRKFSTKEDSEIIDKLYNFVINGGSNG